MAVNINSPNISISVHTKLKYQQPTPIPNKYALKNLQN